MSSELTAKFFEGILRRSENEPTLIVEKIEAVPASKPGDNYMSKVTRFYIEGTVERGSTRQVYKTQVFVKAPIPDTEIKYGPDTAFNELNTYQAVNALQNAINDTLAFPKSLDLSPTLVILEDLQSKGYTLSDRKRNFTWDEMTAVLQEVSKFHAASIVLKLKDRTRFEAVCENLIEHIFEQSPTPIVKASIADSFRIAKLRIEKYWNGDTKNGDYQTLGAKFKNSDLEPNALFNDSKTAVMDTHDNAIVIAHCDCWFNNIMLRNVKNKIDVMLVDLQTMVKTSFARDLITLITTNPSLDKKTIIEIYVQWLQIHLRQSKIDEIIIKKYNYAFVKAEVDRLRNYELIVGLWLAPPIGFTTQPTIDDFQSDSRIEVYISKFLGNYYDDQIYGVLRNFYG